MQKKNIIILILAALILIGAVGVRLLYIIQFSESPLFTTPVGPDVEEYSLWAKQILAGKLIWNYVHIHAPLYAYVLAAEYWIFAFNHFGVRLFQLMAGLAAAIPLILAIRIIDGGWTRGNMIFAAIWAFYPPLIYYQAEYISESLLVPLLCSSIYFLYKAEEHTDRGKGWYSAAGIAGGLAVITHPLSGIFVLFETLYIFFLGRTGFRMKVRNSFQFAIMAALMIAPVSIYNYKVLGKIAPVQANSGFNFYLGNNPEANGTCYLRPGPEWNKVQNQAQKIAYAAFVSKDQYFLSESGYFIRNHPLTWTNLLVAKALYTWNFRELTAGADPKPLRYFTSFQRNTRWAFAVVAILVLTAILYNWRNREFLHKYRHFIILIMAFWIAQIIFVTSGRYRIAMLPGIFVLAAYAIDYVIANFRNALSSVFPYAGIAAAVVLLPSPEILPVREKAEAYSLLGEAYLREGKLNEASVYLAKACDSMYKWSRSYNLLGLLAEKNGNKILAEKYYQKALTCDETDPHALMNLGVLSSEKNDFRKAHAYFDKAFASDDKIPDLHYNFAVFLSKNRGNEILAERHYWKCLELDPSHKKALNNMGVIQMTKGNYAEAENYFSHALRLNPASTDLMVNLAAAKFALNKHQDAENLLQKAEALSPNMKSVEELRRLMKGTK